MVMSSPKQCRQLCFLQLYNHKNFTHLTRPIIVANIITLSLSLSLSLSSFQTLSLYYSHINILSFYFISYLSFFSLYYLKEIIILHEEGKIGGDKSIWMFLTVLDKWANSERIMCEQTQGRRMRGHVALSWSL